MKKEKKAEKVFGSSEMVQLSFNFMGPSERAQLAFNIFVSLNSAIDIIIIILYKTLI